VFLTRDDESRITFDCTANIYPYEWTIWPNRIFSKVIMKLDY